MREACLPGRGLAAQLAGDGLVHLRRLPDRVALVLQARTLHVAVIHLGVELGDAARGGGELDTQIVLILAERAHRLQQVDPLLAQVLHLRVQRLA